MLIVVRWLVALRNYIILVCLGCDASIRVKRGELPDKCYMCMESRGWRIAQYDEYTLADRRLMKSLGIRVDA